MAFLFEWCILARFIVHNRHPGSVGVSPAHILPLQTPIANNHAKLLPKGALRARISQKVCGHAGGTSGAPMQTNRMFYLHGWQRAFSIAPPCIGIFFEITAAILPPIDLRFRKNRFRNMLAERPIAFKLALIKKLIGCCLMRKFRMPCLIL
jgi:hypothetical protein